MIRTFRAFDPRSVKLVIFDLDGTLIDSRLDLVHSVNAALRHIGRRDLPDRVIASYVGDGAPILIQRALGGEKVDEAVVRQGLQFFLSYYREHKLDHTTVYDGVKEALTMVQRSSNGVLRKLAVLSNKPVGPSRAIVEALGLGAFFMQVYGGNSFATKKPDPEGALRLLGEFGGGRKRPRLWETPTSILKPDATPDCSPWASVTASLRTHCSISRPTCSWTRPPN